MIYKKLISVIIFFVLSLSGNAQDKTLQLLSSDSTLQFDATPIKLDGLTAEEYLQQMIADYILDNYLEASIDSIRFDSINQNYIAEVHRGPKYDFSGISLDYISSDIQDELPFDSLSNSREYVFLQNFISKRYADSGYPFARMSLIGENTSDSIFGGQLLINKGPLITIDSIHTRGNINISDKFLYKYLGLRPGSLYNHSAITKIRSRIDQLSYVDQYQAPEVIFFGSNSSIDLYINEKNSSRFDFLFGIIPSTQIQDRSLFLSLDITAELLNRFGSGEYFFFDFERLRPEQQKFEVKFNYPYIFQLNYAFDLDFSIFRNSLDYQTLSSDIGIQYLFNSTNKLKLSWLYESSRLVEVDSLALYSSASLPQDLDINQNGIALELEIQDLDYPFNPQRGYSANFKATGGLKEIQRNSSILLLKDEQTDFSTAYDSLDLKSSRFELNTQFHYYVPLAPRTCFATHVQLAWRYSKSGLYRNEKFQIGGNKLLRGFDEAQFFTSYYSLLGMEYKILLNNNSYLSAPFVDFAFLENNEGENIWALGLGAGLGIQTKAGQLQFSIAVGRSKEQAFDLGRPKAHVGYVSLF